MPLDLTEQLDLSLLGITSGDLDLTQKVLFDPDAVTISDQRTFADRLGFKGGFLKAATNIVTDPLVIAAFFLSRKFPTKGFLQGIIPHRFIGTNNEFSGISNIIRPNESFFRGTNIPRLNALFMQRKAEVLKTGNRLFDQTLARPNWVNEKDIVAGILDGQNPAGATGDLRALATNMRVDINHLWGFLNKAQRVSGGFEGPNATFSTASAFEGSEAPRFLRDFLPHIPLLDEGTSIALTGADALRKLSKSRVNLLAQAAGEDVSQVFRLQKDGRIESTFADFQRFMSRTSGQVFNPRLFRRRRLGARLQSAEGEGLFVTDLDQILQQYVHGVAQTYALNAPLTQAERSLASSLVESAAGQVVRITPTAEPIAVQVINEGLVAAGAKREFIPVRGTDKLAERVTIKNNPTLGALRSMVKNLKGQSSEGEILFSNVFSSIRGKINRQLKGIASPSQLSKVEDAIRTVESDRTGRQLNNDIASYFYATTLGLNFGSTFKNLLQPFLTTAPSIGLGSTLAGFKTLGPRIPRYVSAFTRQRRQLGRTTNLNIVQQLNRAQEKAFQEVFPELANAGLKADPRAFELDIQGLVDNVAVGGGGVSKVFRNREAYFKFLLQPFTQAELSNQVVSFFGAKDAIRKAIRQGTFDIPAGISGPALETQLNFEAANIVNATQFRPGPGSRTVAQNAVPAPFRMFSSFPIRFGNFLVESTVRGALLDTQLKDAGTLSRLTGGRNLGTLARTLGIGRAITTGLRDSIGVDLSDALGIAGPFTGLVESGRIFSPLSFAPAAQVLGSFASFSATRDLRDLNPLTVPGVGDIPIPKTLVPGGVAISRVGKVLRSFRPDLGGFVDDDERLMFRGDTTDLVLGLIGIPLDKQRRTREAADRVRANSFAVRKLRRRYARAINTGDFAEADKAQRAFATSFPEIGTLSVTQKDLRRDNQQARLTTTQRMIRSLGKNFRFLEQDLFELDSDLVAGAPPVFGGITGGLPSLNLPSLGIR